MEKEGIKNKVKWFLTEMITADSDESEAEMTDEKETQQQKQEKEERRKVLEQDWGYRMVKWISIAMDKWFIDPIIGFLVPGFGDVLTSVMTVPFIYVALCKVKSVPLTLAIIYITLMDILFGIIPLVGDVFDMFNRSYRISYRMIVGFVEGDKRIIKEVNTKAFETFILIIAFCFIIYGVMNWVIFLTSIIWEYVSSLFA